MLRKLLKPPIGKIRELINTGMPLYFYWKNPGRINHILVFTLSLKHIMRNHSYRENSTMWCIIQDLFREIFSLNLEIYDLICNIIVTNSLRIYKFKLQIWMSTKWPVDTALKLSNIASRSGIIIDINEVFNHMSEPKCLSICR
jgi:hypothetical protein